MIPPTQYLARFSSTMVQRSRNYLNKVDLETLEINTVKDTLEIYAQVEGTDYYDTFIFYDTKKQRIVDSDCSCPVGHDCKHAAALAQVFYRDYLTQNQKTKSSSLQNFGLQENVKIQTWIDQFQSTLEKIDPTTSPVEKHAGQFIYVLQQKNNLVCQIFKVRRVKSGEIRDAKLYSSFDNLIYQKIAITDEDRQIFQKIYTYSTINKPSYFYKPELDIQNLPLNDLKVLIETGWCYWRTHQTDPLKWSDEQFQLDFEWQQNPQNKNEKLALYVTAPNAKRMLIDTQQSDFSIVYTQPLCLIDIGQATVYALTPNQPAELIEQLLQMPEIPPQFITKVDQTLQQHQITKTFPKPKSISNIAKLYGDPIPVLRFGTFVELADSMAKDYQQGVAEIYFDYPTGRIKANLQTEHFYAQHQGETVCQYRNSLKEQQYFQQLQQLIPSLKWLSEHKAIKKLDLPHISAAVCANYNSWLQHLLPVNQIAALGWKIEHLEYSRFNLQVAQNIELSLLESETQQDWFNVGATIEDQQGNRYDLIQLLSHLIQHYPFMLEPTALQNLDDEGILSIKIGHGQPDLALSIKEIKPILMHLGHILDQDQPAIDRYDASELLELQHQLGMPWQGSEKLQQFAQQLKQGYSQQLPTPQGFQGELRPYQQQGLGWLQFLTQTAHGGILADDMGLGKTAQTLAHLLIEKQAGHLQGTPALIIAPTSLMHNWLKEAEKFTPELKVLVLQGQQRHQYFKHILDYDIILSTYPLLARDEEHLAAYQYHQLILDEAQNIKNPKAKAAQVVRQLKATHRLCLTGTPMENHLGELWSLFYFLMPGFLYTQEQFNKHYRYPIEKQADQALRQKLVNRIKPFMLRRLKTDVAKELPEKTTIEVNIDMNEQQSKLYEAVRATMQHNIQQIIAEKGFKRSQIQILDALLKLRQVCCHPALLKLETIKKTQAHSAKLDYLLEMVSAMVEEGRKILIFSQFTSMLQLIEDGLKMQKIDFVKLTGQTRKRNEVIDAFQSGHIPVFLISLKAGGVGLNLTAADTVIHYDPWWNPAAEDQASDRAWRIGQDKPVFVYKLITNQSIEEKILALQKNKALLAQSILSTDHEGEVKLNEDDVMKLFEEF